jgi:cyanophycinase-like exopeptidase
MNNTRPFYLVAGGRGKSLRTALASMRAIIRGSGKPDPVVAFVGAASMKDNPLVFLIIALLIKAGCRCRIKRVVIAKDKADLKKAREILSAADAVFFSGGDVEVGMRALQEKGMVDFLRELAGKDKLIMGTSAGAIMMGKTWVRWSDPEDDATASPVPCIGYVPLICDTHAEADGWEELKMAVRLTGEGITGYGITSGAYLKAYPDGRLEAEVGPVARYTFRNGAVERMPDLLPGGKMP